ncbi:MULTISPECIES: thioredoxin domain-containing protein [Sphingomonas]|uniref:thioredoxin domain-containing protein n=1 Tax=Sphingomonas TaxID=13687 RepID=UPI0004DB965A|nr:MULTISPECIES: thioredoxin domain-containing protein [Sphingomonas]KQM92826.1 protein-disulfide isomerase [Sphingomonas sp. Leaf226]MBD8698945.1 thioredoxin domain-containing protein [Sphingomonas sp. CFBP 13714]MDY0967498.1 thioredoxin domain-containing protein [Sphingomonas sp. CFBP9021]USR00985.1 DsbA family protein [Sphingomonas aerolata]
MKFVTAIAVLPLALAACSGGDSSNTTQAAAPVAAATAPAGQNWTETVVKTDEGYLMGNPNAPIKLVEYGARSCPTCGAFAREAFKPLTDNYVSTGKVSFEFRDFLVHGAPDVALTLLGQCGGTAPFFPILEQMYQNQNAFLDKLQTMPPAMQQSLANLAPTAVATKLAEHMGAIDFVKQRGIPEAKARACLADQKQLEIMAKPTENAMQSGTVTGTPTFLLNGKKMENVLSWSEMEKALKAAGA